MARLTDRELDLIQRQRHPMLRVWNDPIDLLLVARRFRASYLARLTGLTSLSEALSARVVQPIRQGMRRSRTVRALNSLDGRLLRDIGLERGQIEALAAQLAGTDPSAPKRPNRLLAQLQTWRRHRAAVKQLEGLDDRLLQDIGLMRGEIHEAVYRGSANPVSSSSLPGTVGQSSGVGSPTGPRRASLGRLIERTLSGVNLWYRRHRTISELHALDDRILEDIGVLRSQIPMIAARMAARHGPAAETKPASQASPLGSVILTMRRWNLSRLAASQMARLGPDTLSDLGYVKGDVDWVPEVPAERTLRPGRAA